MTERIQLTDAEVTRLITAAVAEKGEDYVYERVPTAHDGDFTVCLYVDPATNKPSCIAGHVFVAAGVPIEDLATCEGSPASSVAERFLAVSDRARSALNAAQGTQDRGRSWGMALNEFNWGMKK